MQFAPARQFQRRETATHLRIGLQCHRRIAGVHRRDAEERLRGTVALADDHAHGLTRSRPTRASRVLLCAQHWRKRNKSNCDWLMTIRAGTLVERPKADLTRRDFPEVKSVHDSAASPRRMMRLQYRPDHQSRDPISEGLLDAAREK